MASRATHKEVIAQMHTNTNYDTHTERRAEGEKRELGEQATPAHAKNKKREDNANGSRGDSSDGSKRRGLAWRSAKKRQVSAILEAHGVLCTQE